jgi:hypothetical protein
MYTVLEVSKKLWDATMNRDAAVLSEIIDPKALFVHMGITFTAEQEIEVVGSGGILYKNIQFDKVDVVDHDTIAIVYTKMILNAEVQGNDVTNPFVVTEVYLKKDDGYKLASLSYTRINY